MLGVMCQPGCFCTPTAVQGESHLLLLLPLVVPCRHGLLGVRIHRLHMHVDILICSPNKVACHSAAPF